MFAHMGEVRHSKDVNIFAPKLMTIATKQDVFVWQVLAWWPCQA